LDYNGETSSVNIAMIPNEMLFFLRFSKTKLSKQNMLAYNEDSYCRVAIDDVPLQLN